MPEPLSSERLAEIRDLNVDSCSAYAPYNPDVWALEKARTDLLAEVDRLKAANARLEAQVSLLGSHLQRDALDVVDRLRAQAAEQAGQ